MSTAEELRALLGELRESAKQAARASGSERDEALAGRRDLRERLAGIAWEHRTASLLGEHLSLVTARVERLRGATSGRDAASVEVLELRGDLSWLPLGFAESPQKETLLSLTAEAESLGPAVEELGMVDGGRTAELLEQISEEVRRIRTACLTRAVESLSTEEAAPLDELQRIYFLADVEGHQALQDEAQGHLLKRIPAVPVPEAATVLRRIAAENEDLAQEEISVQSEVPPGRAADRLDEVRQEMQWLRAILRSTHRRSSRKDPEQRPARKSLRRWSRRLSRANRRLMRNAQEVRLQARLEGIFGRRFVAFFENLILWLILAVLGILVAEALIPGPRTSSTWARIHQAIWYSDAAICAVFLIEFFARLSLVRGRGSWFLRHFLIDLVPSIPYGLIAHHFLALDKLRAGRAVRLARLPRLLRYVRLARPFVRFFRFFGFLQRAMDRMVRIHGRLLNRNILLFEPPSRGKGASEAEELRERLRYARSQAREAWRRLAPDLLPEHRARRLQHFLAGLPGVEQVLELEMEPLTRGDGRGGQMRAEEIIDRLTGLDPGTVDAELGQASARRLAATLDRLDVPLLRRLPGLKQMIPAARKGEPLERVVAAGKALGRYFERLLERIHWVSDLSGVITGPQFLDRLGTALVQATARPAKRLLLFGLSFLLLKGVVDLLGLASLEGLATWLERVLGTPFLILGGACLVVLLFGLWFRRVAGEATDFYWRTAEAQYINLLKSAKLVSIEEDLEILWDRVLRPEAVIREGAPAEDGAEHLRMMFERGRSAPGTLHLEDRILQLYHDYLDGAIFHISDTKTTSQLLGNLALENIRTERLGIGRKELKVLRELDLDRERSSLKGPYLWFRSITYSVAQWTAKLLLDYNRHAIPLSDIRDYPPAVVCAMEEWLDAKVEGRKPREDAEEEAGPGFVTTEFSALHFLTADEERDRAVAERFGGKTLTALEADRRAMIRTIFGTYPFHRLPRGDRTLNPFEIYGRYLEGGRILLFPFHFLRLNFRILRWLLRRVRATLREILRPHHAEQDRTENWASFDVAVRKINRMRKPVYMECARFRALFDPEYLGLSLSTDDESGVEGRSYREDLEGIAARDDEWDPFHEMRRERTGTLRELGSLVDEAGGPEAFVRGLRGEKGGGTWREAYRAVAIAFAIDYRGTCALTTLRRRSRNLIQHALRRKGRVPGSELLRRLTWILIPSRGVKRALRAFLSRFGPSGLSRAEHRHVLRATRADRDGLGRLVRLGAALEPGTEPEEAGREILREVTLHPAPWSEQLITLRTVQSLSVLDVRNYRRQVRRLGGYGSG